MEILTAVILLLLTFGLLGVIVTLCNISISWRTFGAYYALTAIFAVASAACAQYQLGVGNWLTIIVAVAVIAIPAYPLATNFALALQMRKAHKLDREQFFANQKAQTL